MPTGGIAPDARELDEGTEVGSKDELELDEVLEVELVKLELELLSDRLLPSDRALEDGTDDGSNDELELDDKLEEDAELELDEGIAILLVF